MPSLARAPAAERPAPVSASEQAPTAGQAQPRGNAFAADQLAGANGVGTEGQSRPASGSLARLPNPEPAVEGEISQEVLGVRIIGRGVSPTAIEACARFVNATLASRPDIQDRLEAENVVLVVIPRDGKMTDMPEFAGLRGTRTFDGRLWDDVRGSGGRRVRGGQWAIAVPEENLVEGGPDAYGEGYNVGLHEFAHTIHLKGLGRSERRRVDALYAARKEANGPWTESYGASNAQEYYAQATNCYFGANERVGANGSEWLERNDPEMYTFLVTIYGAPTRRPAANA